MTSVKEIDEISIQDQIIKKFDLPFNETFQIFIPSENAGVSLIPKTKLENFLKKIISFPNTLKEWKKAIRYNVYHPYLPHI